MKQEILRSKNIPRENGIDIPGHRYYLIATPMKLREHPLITHKGLRSWPPVWTWVGGTDNSHPKGEVGILKEVNRSRIEPEDRIFLYMDHENASYLGCLLVENPTFCRQVATLLQTCCGRRIHEIGDLDLSGML